MRIINKQNYWDTEALKKLFQFCINWLVKNGEKRISRRFKLEIVTGRYSGLGRYAGRWALIRLPKTILKDISVLPNFKPDGKNTVRRLPLEKLDARSVAEVFCHEYCHNLGYRCGRGGEMGHWVGDEFYLEEMAKHYGFKWEEYLIPKIKVERKPKQDLQMKRYSRVLGLLEHKRKQLKRLQGQIKKWSQKQRYYEKVLVGAGKIQKKGEN